MWKIIIGCGLVYIIYKIMVLADQVDSTTERVCRLENDMLKAMKKDEGTVT